MSKKSKDKPKPLLNRDIQFLSFNERVLDEAFRKRNRLAERLNYLSITGSNLSEFLSVRYPTAVDDDGVTGNELINAIRNHYIKLVSGWERFNGKAKLVRRVKDLPKKDRDWAAKYFEQNVFPALLPIDVNQARKAIIKAGMYLLVISENKDDERSVGYIEIPASLGRFIRVNGKDYAIAIEDLIQANISKIVRKKRIVRSCAFHIIRSAEVYSLADHITDPYENIQRTLKERENSWVTALEVSTDRKDCIKMIRKLIPLEANSLILSSDMVAIGDLKSYPSDIFNDDEKMRKLKRYNTWPINKSTFSYIKSSDRLCHHPYEDYDTTFVRFLEESADDPDVVSIRISLYRVAERSRIIDALVRAADSGKLVTVLVELKARFDERHNIQVANVLREAGVRIIFTKPEIKAHAKVCLVTRKEKKGLRIYSHIATGNYSEANSRIYSDLSYFTANQTIGEELERFFNVLTSDNSDDRTKHIAYAPYNLRKTITEEIDGQISMAKKKKPALIIAKCNALTDPEVAAHLQEAAKAGVKVKLIVRGCCVLQPQKNLTIRSLVGPELEHARIYRFGADPTNAELLIGSADLMPRNLSHRYELLVRIEEKDIRKRLMDILDLQLNDNVNARIIRDNYKYDLVVPGKKDKIVDAMALCRKEAKRNAI